MSGVDREEVEALGEAASRDLANAIWVYASLWQSSEPALETMQAARAEVLRAGEVCRLAHHLVESFGLDFVWMAEAAERSRERVQAAGDDPEEDPIPF